MPKAARVGGAERNEDRWLSCDDPRKLLGWLRGLASDRKLRLFACAFWRAWWRSELEPQGEEADPDLLRLLEYAEQRAEQGVWPDAPIPGGFGFRWHPLVARDAFDGANWTIRQTAGFKSRLDCRRYDAKDRATAAALQGRLLRDLFGNPFRPISVDPCWQTPTVVHLAGWISEERAFDRLPILADALLDVGCTEEEILGHCRQEGALHARGCWVLDLLTGRR